MAARGGGRRGVCKKVLPLTHARTHTHTIEQRERERQTDRQKERKKKKREANLLRLFLSSFLHLFPYFTVWSKNQDDPSPLLLLLLPLPSFFLTPHWSAGIASGALFLVSLFPPFFFFFVFFFLLPALSPPIAFFPFLSFPFLYSSLSLTSTSTRRRGLCQIRE